MIVSLLVALNAQAAIVSAVSDWKWEQVIESLGRLEFRRPDTREVIRYVTDNHDALRGLTWNTKVYLGNGWLRRQDGIIIKSMLDSGFLLEGDPTLPPPRPRRSRDDRISEIRQQLARLERQ